MHMIEGKVWKFGDAIDTDIIIPARYLPLPLQEMKNKAMSPIRADFASKVREGDVIVAGENFGCGSSREQAAAVLKALGIRAIVAVSFARIFFRNAINLGLPVIENSEARDLVKNGDVIQIRPSEGKIRIPGKQIDLQGTRLPEFLVAIIDAGGLIAHIKKSGRVC